MATKRTASKQAQKIAAPRSRNRGSAESKRPATADLIDKLATSRVQEIEHFAANFDFDNSNSRLLRSYLATPTASRSGITFPDLRDEYANLWAEMAIRAERIPEIDAIVTRVMEHAAAYRSVELSAGVPWYVIALIHNMEASGDFNTHLHNGDPLSGRTVHVPAGRPEAGEPPFTWEDSAADALRYDGLANQTDWSVERVAYAMEGFNGWGYRQYHQHVKSPYLWSFSNQYTSGKYVGDGQWSDTAVSAQCGAMVLLRRLQELGHVCLDFAVPDVPAMRTIRTRGTVASAARPRGGISALAFEGNEIILPYDHGIVPQETTFWCGPASTQVILNGRGIFLAEVDLARDMETNEDGTRNIDLVRNVLNDKLPEARYSTVWLPTDPPTAEEEEKLWDDLTRSINAGYGVAMNWKVPPWNYPNAVKDSTISPRYNGGWVFHYVAAMGYSDTNGERAVWIADSGFWPYGYWCSFHQVATLIPDKGYAFANGG